MSPAADPHALETGLDGYEGTVLAATHDRCFARTFDRFLVFRADGQVLESDEPEWSEAPARAQPRAAAAVRRAAPS